MKKILSFLAAGALALGLIGCSGDLHDDVKVDPNAMAGYWSYTIVDAAEATSGEVGIITSITGGNQSGALGADDIFPIEAGEVTAVIWDGKNKTNLMKNTRTDLPTLESLSITLTGTEAAIFAFTPEKVVNLWVYDSVDTDINLTGGSWPGVQSTPTAEVDSYNFTVTINVTGLDDIEYVNWVDFTNWKTPFVAWNNFWKIGKEEAEFDNPNDYEGHVVTLEEVIEKTLASAEEAKISKVESGKATFVYTIKDSTKADPILSIALCTILNAPATADPANPKSFVNEDGVIENDFCKCGVQTDSFKVTLNADETTTPTINLVFDGTNTLKKAE